MASVVNDRKKTLNNRLIGVISYLLMINIFLFRGGWIKGYSSLSRFIPIMVVIQSILIFYDVFKNREELIDSLEWRKELVPALGLVVFLFTIWINTFLSIIAYQQKLMPSFYIPIEMTLNFLLFFIFLYVIKREIIDHKNLFVCFVIIATIISCTMLVKTSQMSSFRRFKEFGTSVNFLSNSLSIAVVLTLYNLMVNRVVKGSIVRDIIILFINSIGLFLTGSRSGLLSFFIGAGILLWDKKSIRSKRTVLLVTITLTLLLTMGYLLINESMQLLLDRFTLSSMANNGRIELWYKSFDDLSVRSILFGRPWLYEVYGIGTVHPHNFFISLIRYTGILPLLIFSYTLVKLLININISLLADKKLYIALIFVIFTYANVSGNFTRIMTIFVMLGMANGLLLRDTRGSKSP